MTPITALESDAEDTQRKYSANHLEFRSAVIEALPDEGVFEVETPAGNFRMTKAEFHATFPEIVSSVSYRDQGAYHYPKIPYKVFRFLVRDKKGGTAASSSETVREPGVNEVESGHEERVK